MASLNNRRSRTVDFDDETTSRESTPISTAPHDRKRMRPTVERDYSSDSPSGSGSGSSPTTQTNQVQNASSQDDRKFALQPKRKHQPGAIVRVKLTNFVTYTSAEFHPGPNLNMVIGPNGTGKSTLVCAICLGLGWGPSLLGRAKDASEFVKHGCKEAVIEIELQRATSGDNWTQANPVITRLIKKDGNESKYQVNGKQAPRKLVQEIVQGFNIQCDNLCQFLPQDRVVEFAQMNTKEMLETTLKAAADHEISLYHMELKKIREQQQEVLSGYKGDREALDNLEKRQLAQTGEVERLRERIDTQRKIENLEKMKLCGRYADGQRLAKSLRDKRRDLHLETERLEQEHAPIVDKINSKQNYAISAKQNRDEKGREVRRAEDECKRLDRQIKAFEGTMRDCEAKDKAAKTRSTLDKAKLQRLEVDLRGLKQRKDSPPEPFDARAMNEAIQQKTVLNRELTSKLDDLKTNLASTRQRGSDLSANKKQLEGKLEELNTQEGQRQLKFESLYPQAAKGWKWVKENMSMFKKEVYGPPALTCTVKDPRMADYVEALLPSSEMSAITAQCQEDWLLLQKHLSTEQGLRLSLRIGDVTDLSSFKAPLRDEELQRLGLSSWVIDHLEGPATVVGMLCSERSLHCAAIATGRVSDDQHEAISNSPIKTYFNNRDQHQFTRRAEYGASVTRIVNVRPAKVFTDRPLDADRSQQIHRQIKQESIEIYELKEATERMTEEIKKINADIEVIAAEIKGLKDEKDAKQKALTEYNGLDTKIEQTITRIEESRQTITSVKDECLQYAKERDEAMFQKTEAVLQYCDATHGIRVATAELLDAEVMHIEAQSDADNLVRINTDIKNMLERAKADLEKALNDYNQARTKAKEVADELKAIHEKAEETDDEELLDLMNQLTRNKDLTEQHILDLLDIEQAKLDLHAGGVDAANTIREFEERAKKIARLQGKLQSFNESQAEFIASITSVRDVFEPELDNIIKNIDAAFSESFARIGCAGQVAVHKASSEDPADCTEELGGRENGLDFANWAIHISVKFRENEPLSLLDSHRQSGGERAVSTIFYLMALQSLSKSPFRVVDEINQGMDQRNERMVHGRMVDIAAANQNDETTGSQYFLITPKLLTGLKYEKGMTVLCIVSGENMPSATDVKRRDENGREYIQEGKTVDFAAFVRRARQLGLAKSSGDGRVDSGVGIGVRVGA